MGFSPQQLPWLGAGLGYRGALHDFLSAQGEALGFLEVMPEHVLEGRAEARQRLRELAARVPVVTHSVSVSIGTATGPDAGFVPKMARVTRALDAPWTSDHLCFTKIGDRNIGQLAPIPYTRATLRVLERNVKRAQAMLGKPFLLENISAYFQFQGQDYTEPEFFRELTKRTGCGVLLDVNNLRNNAYNLGVKPGPYLDAFPLDRVVQLHLAGSDWIDGKLLDTHGAPIHEEVWGLTQQVLELAPVRAALIERDQTFGPPSQLANELRRAHKLMEAAR
ncbi:MAG TPA: DUF692 domain-containing protein [Candidatus Thermoplasmatota archaeon]|jgi:hypothetical protein|nr:DUF692 domain-containing protein [Candidatus Thermoplasmatota archaeon]